MSKAALCATSTVSLRRRCGRPAAPCRWSAGRHHLRLDAVDRDRRCGNAALRDRPAARSISCRRSLPPTMRVAPIWMISSPSDGFEPGGLGVEHREGQFVQRPVVERAASTPSPGTGRSRSTPAGCRCARRWPRRAAPARWPAAAGSGRRSGGARARARTRTRRRGAAPRRARSGGWSRCRSASARLSQLMHRLGVHRLAGPHQVEVRALARRLQAAVRPP